MAIAALAASCVLIVAAVVLLNRPRLTEPRLDGTWQSDREATITEWRKIRTVNATQEVALKKLFGKMKVTWIDDTFTTDWDGELDSGTYQIIRKDDEFIVVKSRLAQSGKKQVFKIRFTDDNTYWVFLDQAWSWECFRRVK